MISALSALTLGMALAGGVVEAPSGGEAVRPVLQGESFPWYDAKHERVVPRLPWPDLHFAWLDRASDWLDLRFQGMGRWFRWMNGRRIPGIGGAGDLVAIGLAMLLLTLLLVGLMELLRRYRPLPNEEDSARLANTSGGSATRIEGLPAGVSLDAADPLVEARRRRDRGDYAGAIVYLFAHQILTLDRLKQVRLVPGRTGRQLIRSVPRRDLKRCVEPTLRLFEAVYYGHRAPSADAFETAWACAQEFEQAVGSEAVG